MFLTENLHCVKERKLILQTGTAIPISTAKLTQLIGVPPTYTQRKTF